MSYLDQMNVGGTDYEMRDYRLNNPTDVGQSFDRISVMQEDGTVGTASVDDVAQRVAGASTLYFARTWNLANSTPIAATWEGNLAFGQKIEEYLNLGCYLVQTDHTRKKLASYNHYKYANGGTAKLDGSEGHYQWGWDTPFHIIIRKYGYLLTIGVSMTYMAGFDNYYIPIASDSAAGWATMERSTGKLVSYINEGTDYRGGNNDSSKDSAYNTLLGKPASAMTTNAFLTAARLNGDGWLGSSMRFTATATFLFYVIFGTLNIQTAYNSSRDSNGLRQGGLGTGMTNAGSWWGDNFGYYPAIPMSAGIEMGDSCGTFDYTVVDGDGNTLQTMTGYSFFGYKNGLGGIMWRMMTDELLVCNSDGSQTHYIAEKIKKVDDAWTYTISESTTGFVAGSTGPAASAGGWSYITEIAANLELFPTAVGGGSTTYFSDGYYNPASTSGFRLVIRSGFLNVGGFCGPSIVDGDHGVGDAIAYSGSSLCEVAEEWPVDKVVAS